MEPTVNDETPKKRAVFMEKQRKTPISTPKNFARYLLLSNNQSFTPSPSTLSQRVVKNPFENQLHERLHLPMISSPSLFQTLATTPKVQFEWTIDELSLLNPMHLVPHETQFSEDIDPIQEAQAQAAISSYFQEQKIVPSPRECALRNQKIVFKSEAIAFKIVNANDSKTSSRSEEQQIAIQKNDVATQTLFTFPPKLPKEVEDLLRKYQCLQDENDESEENFETELLDITTQSNRSMMDVSTLRRKLFINRPSTPNDDFMSEELCNVDLSPAPRTPELTNKSCDRPTTNGSFGSEFGELSPISPIYMSSNDVSMISEYGKDKTPSRGYCCKKMKKKGKNLSESFCLLQNSDEFQDHQDSIEAPKRFDSGFPTDEDSKLIQSFMQF